MVLMAPVYGYKPLPVLKYKAVLTSKANCWVFSKSANALSLLLTCIFIMGSLVPMPKFWADTWYVMIPQKQTINELFILFN